MFLFYEDRKRKKPRKPKSLLPRNDSNIYGRTKRGKINEAREVLEMGRDIAADTIKGSVRVKVEVNTSLAVLLYRKYPEEVNRANQLCREVFEMSKELEMDEWPESTELDTFCKRNDTCG